MHPLTYRGGGEDTKRGSAGQFVFGTIWILNQKEWGIQRRKEAEVVGLLERGKGENLKVRLKE